MKVTMEIVEALQKMKHVIPGRYIPVKYEGREYVQIQDMDIPTYNSYYDCSRWEGLAIRLGDDITEGYAPIYHLVWYLDNDDVDDYSDTVDDWDKVDDVDEIGEIRLTDGHIV